MLTACSIHKSNNNRIIRLGYMPNVTHAAAIVGINKRFFQDELGKDIELKSSHFVVGNNIIDAFISNQIDIAYVGPGPFINARYRGVPIKLLSNSANGGTVLVGSNDSMSLQEKMKISVPQYGNTQDLILRSYLDKQGLLNKVSIIAIPPQDTSTVFFTMSIDAACLPEPWGTILLEKKICNLLVNEKEILNQGHYPVTVLVVSNDFLKENPELVKKFLTAHKKSTDFIVKNPTSAIEIVTNEISTLSKKNIDSNIVAKAFNRCAFENKLDLNILKELANIGVKAGYYRESFIERKDILNENSFN